MSLQVPEFLPLTSFTCSQREPSGSRKSQLDTWVVSVGTSIQFETQMGPQVARQLSGHSCSNKQQRQVAFVPSLWGQKPNVRTSAGLVPSEAARKDLPQASPSVWCFLAHGWPPCILVSPFLYACLSRHVFF